MESAVMTELSKNKAEFSIQMRVTFPFDLYTLLMKRCHEKEITLDSIVTSLVIQGLEAERHNEK